MLPTKIFWTHGVGTHKEDKNARDRASRMAGIGKLNLVTVSSILPPGIQEISQDELDKLVSPGEIVHAIHGICQSNVAGQKVVMGMGRARPWDKTKTGYVTEIYEHPGITDHVMKQRVETMALQIFADELKDSGYDVPDGYAAEDYWKDGQTTYEVAGEKVEVDSIIAVGEVNIDGDYTCALVAAVLLP